MKLYKKNFKKSKDYWIKKPELFSNYYNSLNPLKLPARLFLSLREKNIEKILKSLKKRQNSIAVDIGCGSGEYTYKLSLFFKKVDGYDVSQKMITIAKNKYHLKNINYYLSPIEKMNTKKKYDYALAIGLLDYLKNFSSTLLKMKKLLKKDGEIIFTCPKSPSLFSFIRNNFLRDFLFDAPEIVESVNKDELIKYCEKNKLKILNLDSLWTTMWIVHAKAI